MLLWHQNAACSTWNPLQGCELGSAGQGTALTSRELCGNRRYTWQGQGFWVPKGPSTTFVSRLVCWGGSALSPLTQPTTAQASSVCTGAGLHGQGPKMAKGTVALGKGTEFVSTVEQAKGQNFPLETPDEFIVAGSGTVRKTQCCSLSPHTGTRQREMLLLLLALQLQPSPSGFPRKCEWVCWRVICVWAKLCQLVC